MSRSRESVGEWEAIRLSISGGRDSNVRVEGAILMFLDTVNGSKFGERRSSEK